MSARAPLRGDELPHVAVPPPGPRSRAACARLRRAEGAAIWGRDPVAIVWSRARGAVVEDLDGNRYLDLTSGFGATSLGHAEPAIRRAVSAQAGRLIQGLGDLMPHVARERLVRRLKPLGGPRLDRLLLASTGSEAVELALKTAFIATGRRRVVAFEGAYHGESYGALAVTHGLGLGAAARGPSAGLAIHIPYANPYRCPLGRDCGGCDLACLERGFETVDAALRSDDPPGAVIVEPIQGRSGAIVPPVGFLAKLAALAHARGLLVIDDEVLTGAGRTGPFWAWERSGPDAEPDLLIGGKGLGGGVALAVLWGRSALLEAWSAHVTPTGEAPHASTFYGHPLACAGALHAVEQLVRPELRARVKTLGRRLEEGLRALRGRHGSLGDTRSAGLLAAVELVADRAQRTPAPRALERLVPALWNEGVLAIPGGTHGNVLTFLPPLTITEAQLEAALGALDRALAAVAGGREAPS